MQDDSKASQVSNVSQDVLGDLCVRTKSRQSDRLSLQSSELGPPTPSPAGERVPPLVPGEGHTRLRERRRRMCPPFGSGGGHTRLRERWRADPIRTRGQTLCYSRFSIISLRVRTCRFLLLVVYDEYLCNQGPVCTVLCLSLLRGTRAT